MSFGRSGNDRQTYTKHTHTRVRAAFYTHPDNGFNSVVPIEAHPEFGHIQALQTHKSLGEASGTFTITVKKPRQMRDSALRHLWRDPESVWVKIVTDVDGWPVDTMLGIIDSLSESMQREGQGQRSETFTISGRCFGKALETTELFVNLFHPPEAAEADKVRAYANVTQSYIDANLGGTPAKVIETLLQVWLGNNAIADRQWDLPPGLGSAAKGGSIFDMLRLNIQKMTKKANGVTFDPSLLQVDAVEGRGKLWDVLQEYSNPILNELWVDLDNDKDFYSSGKRTPTLHFRERPFPTYDDGDRLNLKWRILRSFHLKPGDIRERKVAKGGASNRYNYWLLNVSGVATQSFGIPSILQNGIEGVDWGRPGNVPIFNYKSIREHGLRRWIGNTKYIPIQFDEDEIVDRTSQSQDGWLKLLAAWLKKVHDWYSIAPFELSGTLRCSRIFPEIVVGTRLVEERRNGHKVDYYVEGVDHSWTYGSNGTTQLTVTRGEYEDDNLLAYVYKQYDVSDSDRDEEGTGDDPISDLAFGGFVHNAEQLDAVNSDFVNEVRTLLSEQDALTETEGAQPNDMNPSLDDTPPTVEADGEQLPPPQPEQGPRPDSDMLDQEGLERGNRINTEGNA